MMHWNSPVDRWCCSRDCVRASARPYCNCRLLRVLRPRKSQRSERFGSLGRWLDLRRQAQRRTFRPRGAYPRCDGLAPKLPMLSRLPAAVRLGRARAAPPRLQDFRPHEHFSTHRAQRRTRTRPNNQALYPKHQSLLRRLQSGWRGWANSRSRIQLVAEHAQARLAEGPRLSVFSRADGRSFHLARFEAAYIVWLGGPLCEGN